MQTVQYGRNRYSVTKILTLLTRAVVETPVQWPAVPHMAPPCSRYEKKINRKLPESLGYIGVSFLTLYRKFSKYGTSESAVAYEGPSPDVQPAQ